MTKKEYDKARYLAKKDEIDARNKAYNASNREKILDNSKRWYKNRKEELNPIRKKYREQNKELISLTNKKWRQENKEKMSHYAASHRAAKLQQTPKWADLKAIEEFYINRPEGYEVDHIIPLQGKDVRGLHVLENLQYLTTSENRIKSNKFKGVA